jgi:membrane associated rhomboid family serine protease
MSSAASSSGPEAAPPPKDHPSKDRPGHWLIWSLIGICVLIEVALTLGDYGLSGVARLRQTVFENGAFWPGLVRGGWQPNFPGQGWVMFVTYGFLHGGPVHMITNMLTLLSLGPLVAERIGVRGLAVLYAGSMLGGAGGFGLLAETYSPMVGASGALFGLAGGLLAWDYIDRFTLRARLWPVARMALFLVAINLALWWALDGQLAWETHLGGFASGWVLALLIDPRGRVAPEDA